MRLFNTARILATEHEVDILIVDREPVSKDRVDSLREIVRDVECFFYPKYRFYLNSIRGIPSEIPIQAHFFQFGAVQRWVDAHADNYDLLYANHVRTTEYVRDSELPTVVDLVDAISRNYAEVANGVSWPKRLLYDIESERLTDYERAIIKSFDRVLITTEADREQIVDGLPNSTKKRVSVLPNGVAEELLERDPSASGIERGRITFLGKMDYFPNEDAVVHFVEDVLPEVRDHVPDVEFVVVGASPSGRILSLEEHPNVTVTGFVDDPAEYLARSAVVVAPLRYGAGLQNKVLEAMALGRPVVTTPLGAEGIESTDGTHFLVADGVGEFARAVVDLLENPNESDRIGERARDLIETTYRWGAFENVLLGAVAEAL